MRPAIAIPGLGRDPNSPSQQDLADVEKVLIKIRPYIRNIDSSIDTEAREIVADAIVYPPPDQQRRLFVQVEDSPEQSRAITRIWQRFKTAQ